MQRISPIGMIRWMSFPSPKLSMRALQGAFWTLGASGSERVLGYARMIVLARLLTPGDFGTMGVGLVAMGVLESFTKPGFSEALVRKQGNIDEYLVTLWSAGLYRTVLVTPIAPP